MTQENKGIFEELNAIDVSGKVEKKKTGNVELSYLSWAYAWGELKKKCPQANYEIIRYNNLPYVHDENTGYMVATKITIDNITHEMWLPVMDSANKAMKSRAYTYTTKFGDKRVEAATMFDINKTIMRCLVKNMAMFGLGLYIYAGEDLPEKEEGAESPHAKLKGIADDEEMARLKAQKKESDAAAKRKAAEDFFARIKKEIEDCKTISDISAVKATHEKMIKALEKYPDLSKLLEETVDAIVDAIVNPRRWNARNNDGDAIVDDSDDGLPM